MAEYSKTLHSAEHIFARALQNLGHEIHVRKADTDGPDKVGKAFIREILDLKAIEDAVSATNAEISKNLEITEYSFENLDSALKKFGKLRFNEERIDKETSVRVVKIGEFDYSACRHEHVKNTSEIGLFLVTRVKYLGGETEVEFIVGKTAEDYAIKQANTQLEIYAQTNSSLDKVNELVSSLKNKANENYSEVKALFEHLIKESKDNIFFIKNVKLSDKLDVMAKVIKENPYRCMALMNENQLFISKGPENKTDIPSIAAELKKRGIFTGSSDESHMSGKVTDAEAAISVLSVSIH